FVFPTISLHEAFSYPTSMLLRNLMSMDVEEMVNALPLDSVVLIGGCDKTIPAELMGTVSADMPAIVLPVGSMLAGRHAGARLGACTDGGGLWAAYRAGTLDEVELGRAHDQLMPTAGTCMVMGTASTMASLAETLGFTLPGAATAPAVSSDRIRLAEATGARAVAMAKAGGPTPRQIITKAALRNPSMARQPRSGTSPPWGAARGSRSPSPNSTASAARCRCCSTSSPPATTSWRTSTPAAASRRCGGGCAIISTSRRPPSAVRPSERSWR